MKNETEMIVTSFFPDTSGIRAKTSSSEGAYKFGGRCETLTGLHQLCQSLPFRAVRFRYRGRTTGRCGFRFGGKKVSLVIGLEDGQEFSTNEVTRAIEDRVYGGFEPEGVEFRLKDDTGHQLTPFKAEAAGADLLISFV